MKTGIKQQMYQAYFRLNINQRINERQQRNSMPINHLFSTVISQCTYSGYSAEFPKVNNGLYHHIARSHSKYPMSQYDRLRREAENTIRARHKLADELFSK